MRIREQQVYIIHKPIGYLILLGAVLIHFCVLPHWLTLHFNCVRFCETLLILAALHGGYTSTKPIFEMVRSNSAIFAGYLQYSTQNRYTANHCCCSAISLFPFSSLASISSVLHHVNHLLGCKSAFFIHVLLVLGCWLSTGQSSLSSGYIYHSLHSCKMPRACAVGC